jgi:periplasmic protein CpxP/Spy
MKMHKVSLLAALAAGALLAVTPAVRAEDKPAQTERPGGPRPGQPGERIKKIAEELNLTPEQRTKLEAAMKEQRDAAQGAKDLTPEERRAKMQENRKAMDAKIKAILTPEQYAKWEKLREQNRPAGPAGPGGEKPGAKRRAPKGEKAE